MNPVELQKMVRQAMCKHVDDGATVESMVKKDGQWYASRLCGKCREPLTFTPAFAS